MPNKNRNFYNYQFGDFYDDKEKKRKPDSGDTERSRCEYAGISTMPLNRCDISTYSQAPLGLS